MNGYDKNDRNNFVYFQIKSEIFGGQTHGHYKKSLSTEGSKMQVVTSSTFCYYYLLLLI